MQCVEVARVEKLTSDSWIVFWKREFDFVPGQVVAVGIDKTDSSRIYSLVTGNRDDEAGILFNFVEEGWLTPKMAKLQPGDELFVGAPFGSFVSSDLSNREIWISNGTGVAPFVSMVRSGIAENKTLIHGARTLAHFYESEILSQRLGVNYVRCCSQENAPGVYSGRLTAYLEENEWPIDARYLLCGSAGMVVDVRDFLISRGVSFHAIGSEVYF